MLMIFISLCDYSVLCNMSQVIQYCEFHSNLLTRWNNDITVQLGEKRKTTFFKRTTIQLRSIMPR